MSTPACDLQRFHAAQGDGAGSAYAQALRELRAGGKQSHWIWFVLPQLRGLGRSAMAERYGSVDRAMVGGGALDAAKTISCLTLFEAAGLASAGALLDQLGGRRCRQTLQRLEA